MKHSLHGQEDKKLVVGIEAAGLYRKEKTGADIYAVELIKALQEIDRGNMYVIFCRPGPDSGCISATPNFKIEVLPNAPGILWEQFWLPRAAREHQCTILHCTGNTSPVMSGIPCVTTVHSIGLIEKSLNWKKMLFSFQWHKHLIRLALMSRVIARSQKVITVSQYARKLITATFSLPESKTIAIYNGISTNFNPEQDIRRAGTIKLKYLLPDEFILAIGNEAPEKNTRGVIASYLRYHRTTPNPQPLVLVNCTQHRLRTILAQEGAYNIRHYIYAVPYCSQREMASLYCMASVLLFISHYESFGLPIIEAMQCGLPVITSRTSAMPEIGGNAAAYVDPDNYPEIAATISLLLSSKELLRTMSENGKKHAQQYSWRSAALKVMATYLTMFT